MFQVKLHQKVKQLLNSILFTFDKEVISKILLNLGQLSLSSPDLHSKEPIVVVTEFFHHDLEVLRAFPDIPILQFNFDVFDNFIFNRIKSFEDWANLTFLAKSHQVGSFFRKDLFDEAVSF